jgi:TonB family protein
MPAIIEAKENLEAFLSSRGGKPTASDWTTKKKLEERQFQFGDVLVTVDLHTRSGLVTLGYPVPDLIARRSGHPALWDAIRQALVLAQIDNEIRFIQFYHHDHPPLAAAVLYDQDELMAAVLRQEDQAWKLVEIRPPQPWGGTKGIDDRCSPGQIAAFPGYCVTPPILVKRTIPDYPGVARIKRLGARVEVQFIVQKDGSVRDVAIVECTTPGFGFEKAAMKAVREWKYTPALMHGYPTELRIRATVDFEGRPSQ